MSTRLWKMRGTVEFVTYVELMREINELEDILCGLRWNDPRHPQMKSRLDDLYTKYELITA